MELPLDTHIWIWSVADQARLSPRVRRALENRSNEHWLSAICIWELIVLVKKGRVSLDAGLERWVEQAAGAGALRQAPLTAEVALATVNLPLRHNDPADAFLVATARVFELTLVTADIRLIGFKGIATMANR